MVAPLVAAAGISAAGSLIGGFGSSKKAAKEARKAVEAQIKWERERATNAHQWEVQDLKAAGLNPILSAGGQGATTGGISAPVPDTSGYQTAGSGIGEAIATAATLARTQAEIGKMGSETKNITQDTENKIKQGALMDAQTIVEQYKAGLLSAQTANMELKNLRDKFDTEHQKLTYWNNFLHTASGTAKNVTDAGKNTIDAITGGLFKSKENREKYIEYKKFSPNWNQ